MKLVQSNAKLIQETNPYKLVELVGRTCYKSEDKITDDSYIKFVQGLIAKQHYAMLEHGRLTFRVKGLEPYLLVGVPGVHVARDIVRDYDSLVVSVSLSHLYNEKWTVLRLWFDPMKEIAEDVYLTGAIPANIVHETKYGTFSLIPSEELDKYLLEHILTPEEVFKYKTIKFTCDRGVSHELVRHRCAVAQSSTRYCNYSKDKFGSEITFVEPSDYEFWSDEDKQHFEKFLKCCEDEYMYMVKERAFTPQQARAVLPNALQTEVILTMDLDQWEHFFNLRLSGETGAPHPDMKRVAKIAYQYFREDFEN